MFCHKIYILYCLGYNIAMNTIEYLKETYGYSTPIFLKDIRIGGKSKTSIRKDLSRAVEKGEIIRKSQGVYYFKNEDRMFGTITFQDIIQIKYIKNDHGIDNLNLDVYGYYSGLSFLNKIGISQQVPATLEIVTNKTSCKREITINGMKAIIRRGKIEINRYNYKALQFFDVFYLLDKDEVKENRKPLYDYIIKNLTKLDFERYIGLYPTRTLKLIVEGGLIDAFR